jgi:hypothetical protein
MTYDSKSVNLTHFEDFRFATLFHETHLIHSCVMCDRQVREVKVG